MTIGRFPAGTGSYPLCFANAFEKARGLGGGWEGGVKVGWKGGAFCKRSPNEVPLLIICLACIALVRVFGDGVVLGLVIS